MMYHIDGMAGEPHEMKHLGGSRHEQEFGEGMVKTNLISAP